MTRSIAAFITVAGLLGAGQAFAQDARRQGPGLVEVTIIPGGSTFFTESKDTPGPSFGNYELGGGVAVNFNRFVGVEGEISGSLGIRQQLQYGGLNSDVKTPTFLNYSGNLVVSAANHGSVVPYVTGGIGGLSLFERPLLGIVGRDTFLTGNIGGGLKWYSGRWGLRGDYRFVAVQSKDDAPAFFGRDTRYGHRLYGGVILNVQ